MTPDYEKIVRKMGRLSPAQLVDLRNRVTALLQISNDASWIQKDFPKTTADDENFVSTVLGCNNMAVSHRAVAAAIKSVGRKKIIQARLAVEHAIDDASHIHEAFEYLSLMQQRNAYALITNAAIAGLRRESGLSAGLVADLSDGFRQLQTTLAVHDPALARRVHVMRRQLEEAAAARIPLKRLFDRLIEANDVLEREAPFAKHWKRVGVVLREFAAKRSA